MFVAIRRSLDRPPPAEGRHRDDAGQLSVAVAILAVGALLVISLVYFQGVKLRAAREAASVAEESARAGAGQLDRRRAYATGVSTVDPAAALAQARAHLAAAGGSGTVMVTGARTVRVTVTISRPTPMLSLIGVGSITVTRTATADLVTGVEGEAPGFRNSEGIIGDEPQGGELR